MKVSEYNTLGTNTADQLCMYLHEHHISDQRFSRNAGFEAQAFGKIARCQRQISFAFVCAAARLYGFESVGETWNPYPGEKFLKLTDEEIYQHISANIITYKQILRDNDLRIGELSKNSGMSRDGIDSILRTPRKKFHLRTVIQLARGMELDRVGYIYADKETFTNIVKGQF